MGTDYTKEIGHEGLRKDFKRYQKQTPKGVSLQNKRNKTIVLKFKVNGKPKSKGCNCSFTLDGIVEALKKSKLVKRQLDSLSSETEFWNWYEDEILEKNTIIDDKITFREAVAKVENDFWRRPDRRKRKRDKSNPSDLKTWRRKYGYFFEQLPQGKIINFKDIMTVVEHQEVGTSNYGEVVGSMKKLCEVNKRKDIIVLLEELDTKQTKFMKLQSLDLENFLKWRREALGIGVQLDKRCNLEVRKAWMWVFSAQIIYALRISEVIAIKNLFEPFVTEDGTPIPALNDPSNTTNLIVIGEYTSLGTTTKTGYRLARPNIPPRYPNLIEDLEIKIPLIPTNKPRSKNPITIAGFWDRTARERLVRWNAPYTQTHADRHLGNINGMQAGIPLEVRAMSLGHTAAMNDNGYKNRIGTQTKIDLLLNSNQNAIDFVTALSEAKKLVSESPDQKQFAAKLLSIIYQKRQDELEELLS